VISFLTSTDSGRHWMALGRATSRFPLTQVTTLDAVSADVAYAIGDQGLLSRTGDGGQHWTRSLPGQATVMTRSSGRGSPPQAAACCSP
jgi:photosystem II stability/assembly factor-like uncharacterized protein